MIRIVKVRHCPRPKTGTVCRFCGGANYRNVPPCTCPWCGKYMEAKP